MNSQRTSLESSHSSANRMITSMLSDESSMLNLFIGLQKLLASSSLDYKASEGAQRYDQFVDNEALPKRDMHDAEVSTLAQKLIV